MNYPAAHFLPRIPSDVTGIYSPKNMKKQVGQIFIEQRGGDELAVCVVNSLGRIMTDDLRTPKTSRIDRAGYFFLRERLHVPSRHFLLSTGILKS